MNAPLCQKFDCASSNSNNLACEKVCTIHHSTRNYLSLIRFAPRPRISPYLIRCINELHWLDNGVRSLSTYALAEIFLFSSSKSLDSSAALALSSSAYTASNLDSASAECALLPRGIMSFDDFREALVRVASAEFSRRAHPQLPTEYKIKALLHNVYLAHRAEGLQVSESVYTRAREHCSLNFNVI